MNEEPKCTTKSSISDTVTATLSQAVLPPMWPDGLTKTNKTTKIPLGSTYYLPTSFK